MLFPVSDWENIFDSSLRRSTSGLCGATRKKINLKLYSNQVLEGGNAN
jgi:hypothetical protein